MNIFEEVFPSEFSQVRNMFNQFLKQLNNLDITKDKTLTVPKLLEILPIKWDIHQISHIILYLYNKKIINPLAVIVVDTQLNIRDFFYITYNLIEDAKGNNLYFNLNNLEREEDKEFLSELEGYIKQYKPIKKIIEEYFDKKYNISSVKPIIIPFNFEERLKNLRFPNGNMDIIGFFRRLIEILEKIDEDSRYILSQLIGEKVFSIIISKIIKIFNRHDIPQWSRVWATLLDGLMVNSVIVDKQTMNLLFLCRIIVENKQFTITPLPYHIYKDCIKDCKDPLVLAKKIYERTNIRTFISTDEHLINNFRHLFIIEPNLLYLIMALFEWGETSLWYPDSLLNSFLKLFGFSLGNDLSYFSDAFEVVVKNFENILVSIYKVYPPGSEKKAYQTLIHLTLENNVPTIKLIESAPYNRFLKITDIGPVERLKKIRDAVESDLGVHFKAVFGFDLGILSQSISIKNIENLVEVRNMVNQLPFIASLGLLFVGMKALNVEDVLDKEDALLKIEKESEPTLIKEPLKFKEYFDAFLKKGILFIAEEGKSMGSIRHPLYSQDGYLGIDMDLIREMIEKKRNSKAS